MTERGSVSVSSSTSRIVYAGNNSLVTAYAVPFYFEENAHLNAIAKTAAGVETAVTLTNHTGAGNENGGTVRTAVAVPATSTLTIYREVPFTQATSYEENDAFPAASHERALDKLTTITQQLERRITNCIRGTEATPLSPIPSPTGTQQFVLSAASNQPPSWQELPALAAGPIVATGSTQARFISDRFADVVNVKDFGAVGDCTDQGVGTDVVPAILAAVNHAVTSIGDGAHVVLPGGRFRCSTSCVINLQGKKNITLDFQGVLTADSTAMTVFTVENGEGLTLNAALHEGGIFFGWLAANPYGPCDYATTRNAAAAGGQEMFLLRGLLNYTVHLRAHGYAGRVLRTDERSSPSQRITQAIKGWIHTRRNYDFSKARTAQALWADGGTETPNLGNWGKLDDIVADFDWDGPVWTRLNDIEIGVIDAAYANAGPTFRGCLAVTGDTWYVGDTDQGAGSRHMQFIPSGGIGCAWVDVKFMRFLNKGSGLYADTVTRLNTSVHYITSSTPFSKAVELINCNEVAINVSGFGSGQTILDVSGASTANIFAEVDNLASPTTEAAVIVAASVTSSVTIRPRLQAATSTKAALKIDGIGLVFIESPDLQGSAGCFLFDIAAANNQVYASGGRVTGAATAYESGIRPRSVFNVIGLGAGVAFNFRANQGGNSGSEGGAVEFGIDEGQFGAYSPMAVIKSSLVNSTGTELQGDLKLQVRPFGAAGQTLQDGVVVSSTGTNNETFAKVLTRISGSNVEKRVKVGAAGTGPSGVGRMLFVDN